MKGTWTALAFVLVLLAGPLRCFGDDVVVGGSADLVTVPSTEEESTFRESHSSKVPTPDPEQGHTSTESPATLHSGKPYMLFDSVIKSLGIATDLGKNVHSTPSTPDDATNSEVTYMLYPVLQQNVEITTPMSFREDMETITTPSTPDSDATNMIHKSLVTTTPIEEGVETTTPIEEGVATTTPIEEGVETITTTTTTTPIEEAVETTTTTTPIEEGVETTTTTPIEEGVETITTTPIEEGVETITTTPIEEGVETTTAVEVNAGSPTKTSGETETTTSAYEAHLVGEHEDSSLIDQHIGETKYSSPAPKENSQDLSVTKEIPVLVSSPPSLTSVYTLGNYTATSSPPISECGGKGHITGSRETTVRVWPWAVVVKDRYGAHSCGGVVITSRHVLTAAHCIGHPSMLERFPLQVTVCEHDTSKTTESVSPIRWVSQALQHSLYNFPTRNNNDIGVLVLQDALDTNKAVPICLPSPQLQLPAGTKVHIVGWEANTEGGPVGNVLRDVQATVLPHSACTAAYRSLYKDDRMLCVGSPLGGNDTCQGGGGPLLYEDLNGKWFVVGVRSFGTGCGQEAQYPLVYSSVPLHLDLIKWTMNNA